MRALVTGVAGFIGSRLADRLLGDGHDVVGVDALTDHYDPAVKRANLRGLEHPRFRFVEGDLNALDLAPLTEDVEVVFHQAGQPGVRSSWGADFTRYSDDNICATQRLLEAAVGARYLRRFVFASSSSVYGEAQRYPTEETDLPRPVSPYGVTKLAAEHLCTLYAHAHGLPTASLRYFTVYGPGQRPDMAFTRFCRAVHEGRQIELYGSGEQVRDFTYVDDVVAANLAVASDDGRVAPGAVLNVAGGASTTVNEVLALLAGISGKEVRILRRGSMRGDVTRTGGNTSSIRNATGWSPRVGLGEGLEEQYRWAAALLV